MHMPKIGNFYQVQLVLLVRQEMKNQLIALGYFRGEAGEYAGVSRFLLRRSLDEEIASMTPAERKEYQEILANVIEQQRIFDEQKAERLKLRKHKRAGESGQLSAVSESEDGVSLEDGGA